MSEPYLGQLMCVGFTFNNRGWANCDGQLLPIAQNSALFSLFGTTYGGDGRTTFGLPDLRGRVPIHTGQGPGLPDYKQGSRGGSPTVILNTQEMPSHNHALVSGTDAGQANLDIRIHARNDGENQKSPDSHVLAAGNYSDQDPNATLNRSSVTATISGTTANTGSTQAHNNMQPYQALRWLVALVGIYPSRN